MMLEAVWFKDGKEVALCNPVIDLICEERNNISEIEVMNSIENLENNNSLGYRMLNYLNSKKQNIC